MASFLNQRKRQCKVCFDAKKPEEVYSSHWVKDDKGNVCCPTLLSQSCRYCDKSGHTVKFCQALIKNNREIDKWARKRSATIAYALGPQQQQQQQQQQQNNKFATLDLDSDDEEKKERKEKKARSFAAFPALTPSKQPVAGVAAVAAVAGVAAAAVVAAPVPVTWAKIASMRPSLPAQTTLASKLISLTKVSAVAVAVAAVATAEEETRPRSLADMMAQIPDKFTPNKAKTNWADYSDDEEEEDEDEHEFNETCKNLMH